MVPVNIREYIGSDKSPVDFVLTVFINCGKKAVVVKNAPNRPMNSIKCIYIYKLQEAISH
jgi:hypothetical protein